MRSGFTVSNEFRLDPKFKLVKDTDVYKVKFFLEVIRVISVPIKGKG